MPIGKSKISDMDFGSFENTIDKNIERTRLLTNLTNMMSRNEGVWLSNGWVKTLLWIFLPCFLYTVISIVYLVASCIR